MQANCWTCLCLGTWVHRPAGTSDRHAPPIQSVHVWTVKCTDSTNKRANNCVHNVLAPSHTPIHLHIGPFRTFGERSEYQCVFFCWAPISCRRNAHFSQHSPTFFTKPILSTCVKVVHVVTYCPGLLGVEPIRPRIL